MSSTYGFNTLDDLQRYIVIGDGSTTRPYPSFYNNCDDPIMAQNIAMAWLIAGFASRVIDLQVGVQGQVAPTVTYYQTLASVTAVVPTATKYCEKIVPPDVPWPITPADYQTWLTNLSNGTPTWSGPTPETPGATMQAVANPHAEAMAKYLAEQEEKKNRPPTEGVIHIQGMGGTFCGCKGHKEPDWDFLKPLSRGEKYCEKCVDMKTSYHRECSRGYYREKSNYEMRNRDNPNAPPYREMHPIWEPEPKAEPVGLLPQAEPIN